METERKRLIVEQAYVTKQEELQAQIDSAKERELQAQDLIENKQKHIDDAADRKLTQIKQDLQIQCDRRLKKLQNEYDKKKTMLFSLTYGATVYGIGVTILTALKSKRLISDFKVVARAVYQFISLLLNYSIKVSSAAWSLKDKIPHKIIATFIPGLLAVFSFILLFVGTLGIITYLLVRILEVYMDRCIDTINIIIAVTPMVLMIWFSDDMNFIKGNLIVVYILIQLVLHLFRLLIQSYIHYRHSGDMQDVY